MTNTTDIIALCIVLQLSLCGQSPDVIFASALAAVQFWQHQKGLQGQVKEAQLGRRMDKMQEVRCAANSYPCFILSPQYLPSFPSFYLKLCLIQIYGERTPLGVVKTQRCGPARLKRLAVVLTASGAHASRRLARRSWQKFTTATSRHVNIIQFLRLPFALVYLPLMLSPR